MGAERGSLIDQNQSLQRQIKLLKSQVGNFLVRDGKVPIRIIIFRAFTNLPGLRSIFRRGLEETYDKDYRKQSDGQTPHQKAKTKVH